MKNSLTMATGNKTPSRTPTVGTEAGVNRSATHERISHAMPVSRNMHQGRPAAIAPRGSWTGWLWVRPGAHEQLPFRTGCLFATQCPGSGPGRLMITRFGKYDARCQRPAGSRCHEGAQCPCRT